MPSIASEGISIHYTGIHISDEMYDSVSKQVRAKLARKKSAISNSVTRDLNLMEYSFKPMSDPGPALQGINTAQWHTSIKDDKYSGKKIAVITIVSQNTQQPFAYTLGRQRAPRYVGNLAAVRLASGRGKVYPRTHDVATGRLKMSRWIVFWGHGRHGNQYVFVKSRMYENRGHAAYRNAVRECMLRGISKAVEELNYD